VVVVGVGCLGLNLAQRLRAAEAHLLHVLKGLTRTPQVEEEAGDDLAQHPNVLLGEVAAVERLGVRGEQALAGPRGAARIFTFDFSLSSVSIFVWLTDD